MTQAGPLPCSVCVVGTEGRARDHGRNMGRHVAKDTWPGNLRESWELCWGEAFPASLGLARGAEAWVGRVWR